MFSASIQKLFCGIYLAFKWSFDEFVGEKAFSPSYSSAILAPPPEFFYCMENIFSQERKGKERRRGQTDRWLYVGNSCIFFFWYKCIYFNWRLITLQYCIGFAIHQHESTTDVHVFPILNTPPTFIPIPSLWVIPVHQPQASCIVHRTWTGDSFHIWYCTPFNAILPNHPTVSLSPGVQKTILYICVFFCCLVYRVIVTIFLNSIYMR